MRIRIEIVAVLALTACRAAPPPPPEPPAPAPVREEPTELGAMRQRIRELVEEHFALIRRAHDALDRANYEEAASLHQKAMDLKRQAEVLKATHEARAREAARELVRKLDDEELAVREAATRELIALRLPSAVVRDLSKDLSAEARRRVEQIYRKRQWAVEAMASTEYGNPRWAASQATGEPDTPSAGDCPTAWASRDPDGPSEWIELRFATDVEPEIIRIHETYNPGAIVKVEARDGERAWKTLWEGPAAPADAPRWLEIPVNSAGFTTQRVRLTLDTGAVPGWNEIDAVELVGSER